MKAILFDHHPGTIISRPPIVSVVPDSAITLKGMPVFLPSLSDEWIVRIGVAFRLGRLGKGIARRFARRYIDGVTIAVKTEPLDLVRLLSSQGKSAEIACLFDGALSIGEMQPLGETDPISLEVRVNEIAAEFTLQDVGIEEAIEAVSAYATLKTGDVIVSSFLPTGLPIARESVIDCNLNNNRVLQLKIK